PMLESKGQELATEMAPDADRVLADVRRTTQVFANLISNASKYAPEGTKVTVRTVAADGFVRITVADEGPGIPLDEQNRLFQRFFRSRTVREQAGGLGLGLSICRAIVHAQGGTSRSRAPLDMEHQYTSHSRRLATWLRRQRTNKASGCRRRPRPRGASRVRASS